MKIITLAVGAALALGGAASASPQINVTAEGSSVTRTQAVRYSDLNLADSGAQRTLETRVRDAARGVCAKSSVASLGERADYRRCYADAVSGARTQLAQAGVLAVRVASAD
jgi:UrcA family protein